MPEAPKTFEPHGKWAARHAPVFQRGMIHMLWHMRSMDGGTYTKRLDVRVAEIGSATGEIPSDMNPADIVERIEVVNRNPDDACDVHIVGADTVARDAGGLRGACTRCRVIVELEEVPGSQTRVDAEGLRAALLTGRITGRDATRQVARLSRELAQERAALEEASAILADATRLAMAATE